MNRRGFLSSIAGFAAACMLDQERALWVRGAKSISIPGRVVISDLEQFQEMYVRPFVEYEMRMLEEQLRFNYNRLGLMG